MSSLLKVIVWNNEGAQLLQSGRIGDAAQVFHRAVLATNSLIASSWGEATTLHELNLPGNDSPSIMDQYLSKDVICMCHCPVFFPTHIKMETHHDYRSVVDALTMHVIFNFALAWHCYGKMTGAESSLERAMELYQVALTVPYYASTFFPREISHGVLHCLVFNNLAQLHSEFCEHNLSMFCLECIADLHDRTGCLDTENFNGMDTIRINLALQEFPVTAPAA